MSDLDRFWRESPPRTSRRGNFWIPGEPVRVDGEVYQHGPMFVAWEAPAAPAEKLPVVLVHGGATQATEWLETPDGRPGWAQRLVEAGYPVFVVDRPTQGRSPYHPSVDGPMGPAFSYDEGQLVFFPEALQDRHTQWPFDVGDDRAMGAFIAQFGPLPADLAESQRMDADRIADLLDMIGSAVVVTHSASGPDGWLVADRRPGHVAAIVTVEPMGPAFASVPNIGTLEWGLTAAPLRYDPPLPTSGAARAADPATLRVPALEGIPVAVVVGGASPFAKNGPRIVESLLVAGASAELVDLEAHGVHGNGHGLIYERNSDEALAPVLAWMEASVRVEEHA